MNINLILEKQCYNYKERAQNKERVLKRERERNIDIVNFIKQFESNDHLVCIF